MTLTGNGASPQRNRGPSMTLESSSAKEPLPRYLRPRNESGGSHLAPVCSRGESQQPAFIASAWLPVMSWARMEGYVHLPFSSASPLNPLRCRIKLARQTTWQREATLREMKLIAALKHPFIVVGPTWVTVCKPQRAPGAHHACRWAGSVTQSSTHMPYVKLHSL